MPAAAAVEDEAGEVPDVVVVARVVVAVDDTALVVVTPVVVVPVTDTDVDVVVSVAIAVSVSVPDTAAVANGMNRQNGTTRYVLDYVRQICACRACAWATSSAVHVVVKHCVAASEKAGFVQTHVVSVSPWQPAVVAA